MQRSKNLVSIILMVSVFFAEIAQGEEKTKIHLPSLGGDLFITIVAKKESYLFRLCSKSKAKCEQIGPKEEYDKWGIQHAYQYEKSKFHVMAVAQGGLSITVGVIVGMVFGGVVICSIPLTGATAAYGLSATAAGAAALESTYIVSTFVGLFSAGATVAWQLLDEENAWKQYGRYLRYSVISKEMLEGDSQVVEGDDKAVMELAQKMSVILYSINK